MKYYSAIYTNEIMPSAAIWRQLGWRKKLRVWDGHVHTAIFRKDYQQGRAYYIAHGILLNIL